jgi:hypothetical protein
VTGSVPAIGIATPGVRPRRARLGRYATFQLRDFVAERLAGVGLVLALFGYIAYIGIVRGSALEVLAAGGQPARDIAMRVLLTLIAQSWLFITLVSVNGLVSTDRTSGRYRFTFAKPARPARFYLQGFVLHGLCALACVAIAAGVIMALTAFDPARLALTLVVVGAGYLLVGGICFLASTLWRLDWLATGLVLAMTLLARARWPDAGFLHLLPPIGTVDAQLGRIAASSPLQGGALLHVALYGLACIAIGLVVLHRRPLAR